MTTKSKLIEKLKRSKEYRDAFVASEISIGVPFQIKALRDAMEWTQAELAEAADMKQPRICAMEQAGYGGFTLATLKKLASAFDVALLVRFAPFGELVNWVDHFSPDTFRIPVSTADPVLNQSKSRAESIDSVARFAGARRYGVNEASASESAILREGLSRSNNSASRSGSLTEQFYQTPRREKAAENARACG